MEKIKINEDNDKKFKKKKEEKDTEVLEEWTDDIPDEKIEVFTE